VKRDVQGIVLLLLGVMVARLAIGGQFVFYVAEVMKPWLIISAAILFMLGVMAILDSWRESRQEPGGSTSSDDEPSHSGHSHGPRIAYLLLAPVLAVYLIAPSALGSYTAGRQDAVVLPPSEEVVAPLAAGSPVELPVRDYVIRAVWDAGRSLMGREVQMTGFVTPDPDGGWWLSRMAMGCCAADAQAALVKVDDAPDLPADTWVTVTGTWKPGGGVQDPQAVPLLQVDELVEVAQPRNPYE